MRGDLIETYKIVTGKEKISSGQFFTPWICKQLYNPRGHCHKLTTTRYHLDLRNNFFQSELYWNELSDSVVNASTVNTFKNRLDRQWSNKSSH